MKYMDFKKAVKGLMGYLIIPKFLFNDRAMLYLMQDFKRNDINIFHTYKAFNSNKDWLKKWDDESFRGQFGWAMVYTRSDYQIGKGCWQEIESFSKANLPIYHVMFDDRYLFSRVIGVSQFPGNDEDWSRFGQVLTDDQKDIRPQALITSNEDRQASISQKTGVQGKVNGRIKTKVQAGKKLQGKQ